MMAQLQALLQWTSESAPILFVRDSKYGMPAVQSFHLIGITVFLATIFVLALRLAGVGMMDWSLPSLQRQLRPWATAALTLVLLSGFLIFLGTPSKYLASNPFRFKMAVLGLAILFQFGVVRRVVRAETGSRLARRHLAVAGISLTLWFLVGWAGRAIAFVP